MAELHGNCYKETCTKCKREYLRTFDVTGEGTLNHLTFRQCDTPGCGGNLSMLKIQKRRGEKRREDERKHTHCINLVDTIINFGEDLPEGELTKADQRAKQVYTSFPSSPPSYLVPSHLFLLSPSPSSFSLYLLVCPEYLILSFGNIHESITSL